MAANSVAIAEQTTPQGKGPSLIIQIAVLLAMTVAAVGLGWLSGGYLNSGNTPAEEPAAHAPAAEHGKKAEGHGGTEGHEEAAANPLILDLAPITTNLAAPSEVWVRLEASIALDAPSQDPNLANLVQQDLLAYIRTIKLHQIEGASGFQHLKTDLEERASIRSDGHVKHVFIRTLLFE